ncbi:MAG: hypothetical protein RLY86_3273 [Pseudomonadota bacterium]|jgi:transcriptional regulator with XRE-family HTH domain
MVVGPAMAPTAVMETLKAFGAHLRAVRTEKGLTQEDLAHRTGVSVGYLSQLENGRRNPSLLLMLALGEALGVRVEQLLSGCGWK